jgi:hypothetical protein
MTALMLSPLVLGSRVWLSGFGVGAQQTACHTWAASTAKGMPRCPKIARGGKREAHELLAERRGWERVGDDG